MNDNDNNILIAQQGNCDVALVNGSKVLHYKDKDGNDQSLDIADLVNLTDGSNLFNGNTNLNVDWEISLPNLTNGYCMFSSGLISFTGDLPNLTNGTSMFYYCTGLTSWTVELPNLTNGTYMFEGCSSLTSWTVNLSNLTNGSNMFQGCSKLTSFAGDLTNLTDGNYMFYGCSELTSWTVELPSLTSGERMFQGCILDEASVLRILNSIPAYTSGTRKLHLGKYTNYQTSDKVAAKLRTSTGGTVSTPIPAATNYRCVDDDGNDKGWTIIVTN